MMLWKCSGLGRCHHAVESSVLFISEQHTLDCMQANLKRLQTSIGHRVLLSCNIVRAFIWIASAAPMLAGRLRDLPHSLIPLPRRTGAMIFLMCSRSFTHLRQHALELLDALDSCQSYGPGRTLTRWLKKQEWRSPANQSASNLKVLNSLPKSKQIQTIVLCEPRSSLASSFPAGCANGGWDACIQYLMH